ncbi:magnesium transporter [Haoranjiania flava]|uniref:Magnesium transporter MgtE n=1 Tax=Haoranjiania flava TaxID=1856322 RepID=A0AAE3LLK3_9BACT|nr:magnesium transporter [Haoranjiania flava]MCU7695504.1 magnesium transporter [Haoranjiania flava]
MSVELEQNDLLQEFELLIAEGNRTKISDFLNNQNISDVVKIIEEYPEHISDIIRDMAIHRSASVFKMLDFAEQKNVIQNLPPIKTAALLNELPPDDRVDFLEDLPKKALRDLLKLMRYDEVRVTLRMLGYPEESVGRLMTPDYVWVHPTDTVEKVFETIRKVGKNRETIDVIYVVDDNGELVDDFRIRDLILASPGTMVKDFTDGRVISLNVNDDQEKAGEIFRMNNRVALPVTDANNILLGIVTIDDILWVTSEEFSEDMQKVGGMEALDEPYLDTPFFKLIKKRVVWLIILFLGGLLTATAMSYFEAELQKATVLAIFLPLIIASGGNSGSQASTLVIQAMSVGDVTLADWWRIMRREILSGLTLGIILGIIAIFRVSIEHVLMTMGVVPDNYGEHWFSIALVVGFAIIWVVLWGSLTGSMLPLILKKFGADPAVSSAPFVATIVDVTGIIIYFTTAFMFLGGTLL